MTTELRNRMIADMKSTGLAASTQQVYIHGVRGLAAYYMRSPDLLSEAEVRSYLLYLRDGRGVARGTYAPCHGGIRFLFTQTLDRDWPLFLKKESARPSGSACQKSYRMPKPGLSLAA
jgi:Phage integrase, N-terminal SAM-like domain